MGKAKKPGHVVDALFFGATGFNSSPSGSGRGSKKFGKTKNHHDSLKGNRGNGGGKKNK